MKEFSYFCPRPSIRIVTLVTNIYKIDTVVDYSSPFALIKVCEISFQRVSLGAAAGHGEFKADHHKQEITGQCGQFREILTQEELETQIFISGWELIVSVMSAY